MNEAEHRTVHSMCFHLYEILELQIPGNHENNHKSCYLWVLLTGKGHWGSFYSEENILYLQRNISYRCMCLSVDPEIRL